MTRGPESPPDGIEGAGELFDLLYGELHAMAEAHMRSEAAGHTLQPTAVVHEAWMRLSGLRHTKWRDRSHFLAAAAGTMRRVLVDHARRRDAEKRGGGMRREPLEDVRISDSTEDVAVLALDKALHRLGERSERQMRVVELRFFGGLAVSETAQALGVSEETVKRDWRFARAWLHRELEERGNARG